MPTDSLAECNSFICQGRITLLGPPESLRANHLRPPNTYDFQHKKNKVGSKGCHIVTGTAAISFSHGVITRERHKKVTLATHLSKLSRKKNCYISTTYKIVKILTSHFCIIRHYIYIRGTTYVSHIRLYNLMIYITKYKNVSIYVSSSLSNSPTTMTNLSDCR